MAEVQDALMYAIAGEQMPASMAGSDEAAEAQAAVDALRRGLAALGTELAAAEAEPEPAKSRSTSDPARTLVAVPRRKFWTQPRVLTAAAAAVGVAIVGGVVLNRPADPADNSGSRSLPGVVACAETIAEGDVTAVTSQGDRFAVTLDVTRYLKPENGPATLSVTDARLPVGASSTAPVTGDRALIVVHDAAKGDVDVFTGADIASEWAWMEKALPDSRAIDPKGCTGE
jgi:hypothetical protein